MVAHNRCGNGSSFRGRLIHVPQTSVAKRDLRNVRGNLGGGMRHCPRSQHIHTPKTLVGKQKTKTITKGGENKKWT
jgi:hypothetical protein